MDYYKHDLMRPAFQWKQLESTSTFSFSLGTTPPGFGQLRYSGYQEQGVGVWRAWGVTLWRWAVGGQRATVGGEMLQSGKRGWAGSEALSDGGGDGSEGIHCHGAAAAADVRRFEVATIPLRTRGNALTCKSTAAASKFRRSEVTGFSRTVYS